MLENEELLTLTEAAKALPKVNRGQRISVSSVYRWAVKGINGVRLEHRRFGGRIFTSVEALDRFGAALAEQEAVTADHSVAIKPGRPKRRTPEERAKAVEAARAGTGR